MQKKNSGYSLIELLLVLVLIGTIVAMTVNFSLRNKDRWSLRDAARELTSVYYQGKQRAARENSSVRINIEDDGYSYSWNNAGVWEDLRDETFPTKISAVATADFLINPSGFILDPATFKIAGAQTVTLNAPRGENFDTITITIYPYGGLRVEKDFK